MFIAAAQMNPDTEALSVGSVCCVKPLWQVLALI